ncbi:hypothetical protein ACHAWF_013768 [Thalassiosira exigua]
MDISLGHGKELRKQHRAERRKQQQQDRRQQGPENVGVGSPIEDEESLGHFIGEDDPFELAYVQPVIRASPHARPEQPFPPPPRSWDKGRSI